MRIDSTAGGLFTHFTVSDCVIFGAGQRGNAVPIPGLATVGVIVDPQSAYVTRISQYTVDFIIFVVFPTIAIGKTKERTNADASLLQHILTVCNLVHKLVHIHIIP
jgi:hypothetical protein